MLFAIEAQFKGSITQGRLECIPTFFNQFFAALVCFVSIYDLTQFCLNLRKGCPCFLRPFTEVLFKAGQGQTTAEMCIRDSTYSSLFLMASSICLLTVSI